MTDSLSLDALPPPHLRLPLSIDNPSAPQDAAAQAGEPAGAPSPAQPPDLAALKQDLVALYRTRISKVVGFFRHKGQSEESARDLTQETFINALNGLHTFKGDSALSTWLWKIAKNVLLAHVRGRKPDQADADAAAIDPDSLSIGGSAHLNPVCDCIRRGFAAFHTDHPERAEVVYLAVVEGWTREELAAYLGRSVHAATEYLSQCKARFRPYIEACDGD
jgi:RNA polymerase sigma-70 factor, ECF subfamily